MLRDARRGLRVNIPNRVGRQEPGGGQAPEEAPNFEGPLPGPPENPGTPTTSPVDVPDVLSTLPAFDAPEADPSGPQDKPEEKPPSNFEGPLPGPGTGESPGGWQAGTPTTSPVVPGEEFTIQPISPGDLPLNIGDEPDQNARTGRTDEDSKTANMKDKSATEDVQNEVIQTDVEAKETGASSTPWYDPFGWFTGPESDTSTSETAFPLAVFAIGGLVIYFSTS